MNLLLWKWSRLRTRPTRIVVLPAAVAAVAAAIAALCAAAILAAHPACWTLLRSAPAILPRELSTMTPVLTSCVLLSTRGPFTMVPRVADATRPHHASRSYHAWHAHRAPAPLPGGRATRGLTPHAPPPPPQADFDNAGSDDSGDAGGLGGLDDADDAGGLGGLDDADGADADGADAAAVPAIVHAWPLHNGATRG